MEIIARKTLPLIIAAFLLAAFSYVSAGTSTDFQINILSVAQCSDGLDNDSDGLIDYPADPDCVSSSDNSEYPQYGGGGGVERPPRASLSIAGKAYPFQPVLLLKDAQQIKQTTSDENGDFSISLNNQLGGNYIFSLLATDINSNRSNLFTFPATLNVGSVTSVRNIFISPTITSDKSQVKQGAFVQISGQTYSNAQIEIIVTSPEQTQTTLLINADINGLYSRLIDTTKFDFGEYEIKTRASNNGQHSPFSQIITVGISYFNIPAKIPESCAYYGDLNGDCRVNLIDFSIAAYWYQQKVQDDFATKESQRLNNDGVINLTDFSIMAYYWTG